MSAPASASARTDSSRKSGVPPVRSISCLRRSSRLASSPSNAPQEPIGVLRGRADPAKLGEVALARSHACRYSGRWVKRSSTREAASCRPGGPARPACRRRSSAVLDDHDQGPRLALAHHEQSSPLPACAVAAAAGSASPIAGRPAEGPAARPRGEHGRECTVERCPRRAAVSRPPPPCVSRSPILNHVRIRFAIGR